MDDASFPAAEKILIDIENVVKKNLTLRSFEIVPAQNNENRSPMYHELSFLGLESWCVEPLYCYVYRRLLDFRQNRWRCTEPGTVARWLLGALLINPNVIMLWNMRRELVQSYRLDPCEELTLTRVVLYHKPNSFEAFAYRRWLMQQILDIKQADTSRPYDPASVDSLLSAEMQLVESCADRYASNYHAWSYRRFLVTLSESRGLTHPSLKEEWRDTHMWCKRHVSDSSAYSYRQFLLIRCVLHTVSTPASAFTWRVNPRIPPLRLQPPDPASPSFAVTATQWEPDQDCSIFFPLENTVFYYMDQADVDKLYRSFINRASRLIPEYEYNIYKDKLVVYIKTLGYWAEESMFNEQAITALEHNEVLWCHRRFLAQIIIRLTAMYVKYGCYIEDELLDVRHRDEPIATLLRENPEREDPVFAVHMLLLESFRISNNKIAEVVRKRDPHEGIFVDRFFKFVENLGSHTVDMTRVIARGLELLGGPDLRTIICMKGFA